MRTSALLAFIFAAVSAPSLAAPIVATPTTLCDRLPSFCHVRPIGPISFTRPVNTNILSGSMGNQQRGYGEDDDSGAILATPWMNSNGTFQYRPPPPPFIQRYFGGIRGLQLKRSHNLHELILRAVDDESGAANWKKWVDMVGTIIPVLFGGHSSTAPPPPPPPSTDTQQPTDQQVSTDGQQQTQQRRELLEHVAREYNDVYELLARAAADDESGAGLFSIIKTFAGPLINMFTGGSNNQRRAMVELLTRAAQDDESGADFLGVLGDVGNAFLKIFGRDNNQRREMVELLARAAEDDESGAGILDFITSLFTRDSNQRREMVELLARAAEDDESGAGLFSFIRPLASTLINVLTGGGSNQQQQHRDLAAVVELLARANYDLE